MRTSTVAKSLLAVLALPAVAAAGEQEARKRFQEEIKKVYNYLPSEVEQSVRDSKVAEMDGFWNFVKSDLDTNLPLLREALRDKDQNIYFCFDGSALLFELSKTPEDLQVIVAAFSRSRIEDVGPKGYFYFLHTICGHDVDVFPVVSNILDHADFHLFVPQHAMRLDQADAVVLCLMRQDERRWVPALARRLGTEKETTAKQTIVLCLGLAVDAEAQAALRKFAETPGVDPEAKDVVGALLEPAKDKLPERKTTSTRKKLEEFLASCEEKGRVPYEDEPLMQDAPYLVVKRDEASIRTARRKAAKRVSDEAMADIRYLTLLLQCATTSKE
jgi:hypothetical protein